LNGLDVAERELQEVVNALKAKQILIGGAGKLADQYVKTRNSALHANWEKVSPEEVGGLIGFVESLLVKHLS
jgi:hypothetical protein